MVQRVFGWILCRGSVCGVYEFYGYAPSDGTMPLSEWGQLMIIELTMDEAYEVLQGLSLIFNFTLHNFSEKSDPQYQEAKGMFTQILQKIADGINEEDQKP
jgi:hypothetical protein